MQFFKKHYNKKFAKAAIVLLQIFLLLYNSVSLVFAQTPTSISITPNENSSITPSTSPSPTLLPTSTTNPVSSTATPSAVNTEPSRSAPSAEASPKLIDEQTPTATPALTVHPTILPTINSILTPSATSIISGRLRRKPKIRLGKNQFNSTESVTIPIENGNEAGVKIELYNPRGEKVEEAAYKQVSDSVITLLLPSNNDFTPGKYTIIVTDSTGEKSSQDFSWGVLAINPSKSIYLPEEKANIYMAVLDDKGEMVCNANVNLTITSPDGTKTILSTDDGKIKVNDSCSLKELEIESDYEASYQPGPPGRYNLDLSATTKNGTFTATDFFEVRESVPFDIERQTATRIFPVKNYPVTFAITAYEDFKGTIEETVPESFATMSVPDARTYDKTEIVTQSPDPDSMFINLHKPFAAYYVETLGFGESPTDQYILSQYIKFGVNGHDGIDFALPQGTEVLAVDDGEIVLAGAGVYGVTVVIQHSWGKSYYGHLSKTEVELGQKIKKGDEIALSGNTGLTTGPHLHFGIKLKNHDLGNGYYGKTDPAPYLSGSSVVSENAVKKLIWNVDLKKGEKIKIGYQYDPPDTSPEFYLLGPLKFIKAGTQSAITPSINTDSPFVFGQSTESAQFRNPQSVVNNPNIVFQELRQWQIASDTQVQIDDNVHTTSSFGLIVGSRTVFTTDQIGYVFYRDSGGNCVYKKTTNAGSSWGTATQVDDTNTSDCIKVTVWYDQWTPTDTSGTKIHILTQDSGADDLWYRSFDTNGDTFAAAESSISTDKSNSFASTSSLPFISKGTDGDLYAGVNDTGGGGDTSFIKKCTATCTTGSNWSDAGTLPFNSDDADDEAVMMPRSGGNMLLLRYDNGTAFDYNIFTDSGSTWSGWTNIDTTNIDDHTTYEGQWGVTQNRSNYDIYLAFVDNNTTLGSNDDISTWVYTGSWSAGGDVVTNSSCAGVADCGLTNVKLLRDENNGDIYALYTAATTPATVTTQNVYWKKSTDNMTSWGSESSAVNTAADDIYGANMNYLSNERAHAQWTELNGASADTLEGDTIADFTPSSGPTNDQLMRHGNWFSSGVEKTFTF